MQTEPEQWAVELWEAADAAFDAWPDGNAHRASHAAALSIQRAFEEREWKLREAATTQPSGDVVEAVALAILNSDRGMRGLDPLESRENVPDSDGYVTNATAAITTYEAVSGVVNTIALQEVTQIATYLWRKHYRDDAPDWRPLPDLRGVISQIDNMVTGLTRARAALGEKP